MTMSFIRLRRLPRYQVWASNSWRPEFSMVRVWLKKLTVRTVLITPARRGRMTKVRVSKEHSGKSSWSGSFCHSFEEAKVLIEQWR